MKKIFAILVLAVMMMLPMSSFAATTVSDSDLAGITGQSGVSINLDVTIDLTADVVAWGDSDGLWVIQGYNTLEGEAAFNNAGYVGLQNMNISNLNVRMRDFSRFMLGEASANDTEWNTIMDWLANDTYNTLSVNVLANTFVINNKYSKALTIDVGSNAAGKTIVSIGVPTAVISLENMTANVALWAESTTASNNPNKIVRGTAATAQVLGELDVNGLVVYTWGGRVDISKTDVSGVHPSSVGVNIGFRNVTIDAVYANGISWGDPDGVVTGLSTMNDTFSKAGYVGIGGGAPSAANKTNMIQNLVLNGDMTIDVGSVDTQAVNVLIGSGWPTAISAALGWLGSGRTDAIREFIYSAKKVLGTSPVPNDDVAYVHIGLVGFEVDIEQMRVPIYLWSTNNIVAGGTSHELGLFYARNLNVKMDGWVDILAH